MRSGFEVQRATIFALFLREIRTRFGKYRLGYLWAVLQPGGLLLMMLAAAHFVINRQMPGISYTIFFTGGIVPWFLFNNIAVRSLTAVQANAGLFNYRPVKPIDTIIARSLLELIIYSATYACLLLFAWLIGDAPQIDNLIFLVGVFFLIGWFSMGVGLILMIVGDAVSEADKIMALLMRPLFYISGVFFSVESIPPEYRGYVLWNPLTHAIELNRIALFSGYEAHDASLLYLFLCSLVINVTGLLIYRFREKAMLSS